jgi:hypothetical protein
MRILEEVKNGFGNTTRSTGCASTVGRPCTRRTTTSDPAVSTHLASRHRRRELSALSEKNGQNIQDSKDKGKL